jgi:hypothetical protein
VKTPVFRLDWREFWLLAATLGGLVGLIGVVMLVHFVAVR